MRGTFKKKVYRENKGITLIALVVTIIVLLILAGVSIAMLTGEGGILQNAREAKDKTERADIIEQAQLDIAEKQLQKRGEDITEDELKEILEKYGTVTEEEGKEILDQTLKTDRGNYEIKVSEIYSGEFSGSTPSGSKKVDDLKNAKQLLETNTEVTSDDDVKVTVPAGFTIPNESPSKAIDGIIITDSIDETTGASTGNEFVWIPVDENLKVVGTEDKVMAEATSGNDDKGKANHQGVFYSFSSTTSTKISKYGQSTTSYREPDVLSDSYDNKSDYLNIITNILATQTEKYSDKEKFKTTMQEDYNEMIDSVKTYGGFYVGRYEMGLENGKAISKKGPATDASQSGTSYRWYGLYAYGKTYENTKKTETSSVKSSMIWGSQYDAMLNYALLGDDKGKVTVTGNGYTGDSATNTGDTTGDKILNIYDLEGNHREWTLEAEDTKDRVYRGGSYYDSYSPSDRNSSFPYYTSDCYSSRLTLYVQV